VLKGGIFNMKLKTTKIRRNDYENIYFASDFHYNHRRDFIWTPRGFTKFEDHDKFIEDECDKLTKKDLLIYLGDFSLNSDDEKTWNLVKRIKADIIYVAGNHESVMSRIYKNALKGWIKYAMGETYMSAYEKYPYVIFPFTIGKEKQIGTPGEGIPNSTKEDWDKIVFYGEEVNLSIGNLNLYCRHMAPLIWDHMKEDSFPALCGHSHGNCEKINIYHREGKILDVGVDNALIYNKTAFFRFEDIVNIMQTKVTRVHDHHGEEHV
jgi:hypothetical protein